MLNEAARRLLFLVATLAIGNSPFSADTTIAIRNESRTLTDADVRVLVPVLDRQLREHVAAEYGAMPHVVVQSPLTPGAWVCRLYDGDPLATAYGEHDVDVATSKPYCSVNVAAVVHYGQSLSVTLSHEVIELATNPRVNRYTMQSSGLVTYVYLQEAVDPVQSATYRIDSVEVSDFVYPAFWRDAKTTLALDRVGAVHVPLSPAPGGRISVRAVTGAGLGPWMSITDPGFCFGSLVGASC